MERDAFQSLLGKRRMPLKIHNASYIASRSRWLSDASDLVVLLCSFLFTTAALVLVGLILSAAGGRLQFAPLAVISNLQRGISALSAIITSAVIMVAGKRYVLFKLAQGGIRSWKASAYANPSVGNLFSYLLWQGVEWPLLTLLAVWGLALATGLSINDSWGLAPQVVLETIGVPFGSLDVPILKVPGSSWVTPAAQQLALVTETWCLGVHGIIGLIKISGLNITTGGPSGIIYYPPRPQFQHNVGFSITTILNSFTISVEQLSSVPPTAQNTTCVPNQNGAGLWYDDSDNQTLSLVTHSPVSSPFRFNATPILVGGTLSSTGNYTEFVPNGTWWPNVMSSNQWARDITSLICNTTLPSACLDISLTDISPFMNAIALYTVDQTGIDQAGIVWSTILGLAMGAYSSAMWPLIGTNVTDVPMSVYGVILAPLSGIYVLIANIVVSAIMLVVVVRLRMGSSLGADFLNPIRLLLDPLKNPNLFDASLDDTIDAFANPYLQVQDSNQFLVVEGRARSRDGETDSV